MSLAVLDSASLMMCAILTPLVPCFRVPLCSSSPNGRKMPTSSSLSIEFSRISLHASMNSSMSSAVSSMDSLREARSFMQPSRSLMRGTWRIAMMYCSGMSICGILSTGWDAAAASEAGLGSAISIFSTPSSPPGMLSRFMSVSSRLSCSKPSALNELIAMPTACFSFESPMNEIFVTLGLAAAALAAAGFFLTGVNTSRRSGKSSFSTCLSFRSRRVSSQIVPLMSSSGSQWICDMPLEAGSFFFFFFFSGTYPVGLPCVRRSVGPQPSAKRSVLWRSWLRSRTASARLPMAMTRAFRWASARQRL
mmetsp:Transcript_23308/g.88400  ORF Transcript_23308/g.88400 Transcript_23308/m.88400 type:complete len:307 (-) Transcript_23308:1592-2512(-)